MDVMTQVTAEMNKTTDGGGTLKDSSILGGGHFRELKANGRGKYLAHRDGPRMGGTGLAGNRGEECVEKCGWDRGFEHRQQ